MIIDRSGLTNRLPEKGYIEKNPYQCLQEARHAAAASSHPAVVECHHSTSSCVRCMMEEAGGFRIGWVLRYRGKVHGRPLPQLHRVLTSVKCILVGTPRCLCRHYTIMS
jgi:hypothetical protein